MPVVSIRIPQMGEGLQEARLVAFLKKPGDKVKRDEPLYQMETDKAVMDVESPYEGVLLEWLTKEDVVLPIGTEIAKMEVAEGVREMPVGHEMPKKEAPVSVSSQVATIEDGEEALAVEARRAETARNRDIPPKTRRYLKEKGLLEVAHLIPSKTQKLMPEDVDAYLAAQSAAAPTAPPSAAVALKSTAEYEEFALSQRQRTLSYRLARGAQVCVPGTIMTECGWEKIEEAREELKRQGGEFQPSAFTMMAWCVVQAMKDHPKFRSIMPNENTLRTYKHVHLGIAVALPGDELVTAVVPNADTMSWREFAQAARQQIELARNGQDQATEATTLSITNMSAFGLLNAVPVVVSPAVATLFLGEPYWKAVPKMGGFDFSRVVMLSLTFDHRVINGVGAANFLNDVKAKIENFSF
ncbi:MAG TPA: 2-oxo acid dehydrogenase subunit E2 [Fimbriimonadales bacterium]|nr:2-oxo acid dehydrogenase subunit E2 [Fimbriimonadales bacterium]